MLRSPDHGAGRSRHEWETDPLADPLTSFYWLCASCHTDARQFAASSALVEKILRTTELRTEESYGHWPAGGDPRLTRGPEGESAVAFLLLEVCFRDCTLSVLSGD